MNIEFYDTHMETLRDLQNFAEKHNCKIRFGVRTEEHIELDYYHLLSHKVPKYIINKLLPEKSWDNNVSIKNVCSSFKDLWFELYDPNNEERHYHTMSYREYNDYFEVEPDYNFDKWDDKNQKFIDWCDENQVDWNDEDDKWIFNLTTSPTVINGFQYKKEHTDFRVYRGGMALHYFVELVCKYLKEPMIERTY